jgi:hypothetical protein
MAKKDVDVSRVPITVHRTANTVKAAPMLSQSILRVRGSLSWDTALEKALNILMRKKKAAVE